VEKIQLLMEKCLRTSDYEKITTKVGSANKLEYYKKDNIILLIQSNFKKIII
jgi:hypothetical protein